MIYHDSPALAHKAAQDAKKPLAKAEPVQWGSMLLGGAVLAMMAIAWVSA